MVWRKPGHGAAEGHSVGSRGHIILIFHRWTLSSFDCVKNYTGMSIFSTWWTRSVWVNVGVT